MLTKYFRKKRGNEEEGKKGNGGEREKGRREEGKKAQGGVLVDLRISEKGLQTGSLAKCLVES